MRLHPFPLFLSLSSFSFSIQTKNTTYLISTIYLPIYISFICVTFVTLTNAECFAFIPLSLLHIFVLWLCVAPYLLSERFFVSFFLNRPTPPGFHGTESVATPFLNFFIFLVFKIFYFQKFFC